MKKALCMAVSLILAFAVAAASYAAEPSGLTWDGRPATLSDIARETGYDLVDASGRYKPMYASAAKELWVRGLFLGSGGSFALNEPLTSAEGTVMILRLLGKEAEAMESQASSNFADLPAWAAAQIAYAASAGIVKGYSETVFGSADAMPANQYITLVLRALGYVDGEDFAWGASYDKALEIGLIDESCRAQYARSNLFLRDNAAAISRNALLGPPWLDALFGPPKKGGGLLIYDIPDLGRPEGDMPAARLYGDGAPEPGGEPQPEPQAESEPQQEQDAQPQPEPTPAPAETADPGAGELIGYDLFPTVPAYENVDADAVLGGGAEGDGARAFYFYETNSSKLAEYRALLLAAGFSGAGSIRDTLLAYNMEYYRLGNIHVAIGMPKKTVYVRIVEKELDSVPSANELRALAMLFNH